MPSKVRLISLPATFDFTLCGSLYSSKSISALVKSFSFLLLLNSPDCVQMLHDHVSTWYPGRRMAPLLSDSDRSRALSRLRQTFRPMPLHSGHIPAGSLNENKL